MIAVFPWLLSIVYNYHIFLQAIISPEYFTQTLAIRWIEGKKTLRDKFSPFHKEYRRQQIQVIKNGYLYFSVTVSNIMRMFYY